MIRFSVLMSVYGKEKAAYFEEALCSILKNQTRIPDELVLVCDGPLTEELDKVISQYVARYPQIVHIIRLKENRGLGNALNTGLKHCTYDLIARADSDDICLPQRFEKQINYMKKHPEVDLLGSDLIGFDEKPDNTLFIKKMPVNHNAIASKMKISDPINHMTVIYRKKAVEVSGSYQELLLMEDYYLWIRMLKNGAIFANLNEPLVLARSGYEMMSRRSDKINLQSYQTLCRFMLDHSMITRIEYFRNLAAMNLFVRIPVKLKRKLQVQVGHPVVDSAPS